MSTTTSGTAATARAGSASTSQTEHVDTMFASSTVARHYVRGALGLALVVLALVLTPAYGAGIWLVALPALVLWRGCPTCWTLGLIQTRQVCAIRRRP